MKLLLIHILLVALVSGGTVPLVSEDNSNHAKDENHNVLIVDDEVNPVLEDLREAFNNEVLNRNSADNEYWLYTRVNPSTPQIIIQGNSMSIWGSNYLGSRPLKVIIHGFAGSAESEVNPMLVSAWLAMTDANVIVVDWRKLASSDYVTAVNQAPMVGRAVATFINWLINTAGGNWNMVHLAGFGLGGQIAGIAGRHTSSKPRRLTGLDPVGLLWDNNPEAIGQQGNNEAQYVEIIHTAYERKNSPRIGHVDFYPNGGNNQPGCSTFLCSHNRAYQLFAATIHFNHLIGIECADANEAQSKQCSGSLLLHMGNAIINKNAVGIFRLSTGISWPF